MGSFKRNGRNQGPDRRRGDKGQRGEASRASSPWKAGLLLATGSWKPTTTNLADVQQRPDGQRGPGPDQRLSGLPARTATPRSSPRKFPLLQFQGNSVAIEVNGTGNFNDVRPRR